MRKLKIAILLAVAFLAVSLSGMGRAAAAPPQDYSDPATINAVIQRLADAGKDADQVWAALSPQTQQAVQQALTVARVETSVTLVPADSTPASDGVSAQATSCLYGFQVERYGKNSLGQKLWSYFQKIDWCYNGSWITSKFRVRWGEVYFPFWEFKGHIGNSESGGVGYWSYRAWTQGKFALCAPYVGCAQYKYPWIDMTVYANGGWTWSAGG
jgi:hypothetical protein